MKESISRGEDSINILINSNKLEESNNNPKNNAPRKVLPPSPINTFEGYQFHNRNANKEPTNIKNELDITIEPIAKIKTIEPDTNPSIPSIKFMRLIIVVPMINNNINKIKIKYFSNSPKSWINWLS